MGTEPYFFYWMGNKKLMTFFDWDTGEPNNFNGFENCLLQAKIEYSGKWNDAECHLKNYYICEDKGKFYLWISKIFICK